jgi:hypothetical protein
MTGLDGTVGAREAKDRRREILPAISWRKSEIVLSFLIGGSKPRFSGPPAPKEGDKNF